MPNGHHGTEEEWKRLEAPLREIDAAMEAFAKRHKMAISRNYHNWPERSLRWGSDPERLIQIYLEDDRRLTWKREFLRHDVPMGDMSPVIDQLLDEAFLTVSSWRPEELELATTVDR
jgi:hypothetical protein